MRTDNLFRIFTFLTILVYTSGFSQEEAACHPLGEWRKITSGFGYRDNPFNNSRDPEFHKGADLAASIGDSIYAWRAGVVIFAGYTKISGNMIHIQHENGYISKYHHLSRMYVDKDDFLLAGQFIGKAGKTGRVTGPHLHFTLVKNGKAIDPLPYLKQASNISKMPTVIEKTPIAIYKYVSIRSFPVTAHIAVDGEAIGNTPLDLELTYGEHFIEFDGGKVYGKQVKRIWIDENFNRIFSIRLTPVSDANRKK